MRLSKFTFSELTKTDTGLRNIPITWEQVENLIELRDMLDEIRIKYAAPIVVNSAYRSPQVNAAVGGVPNSLHIIGRAADIRPNYYPARDFQDNFQRLIDVIKYEFSEYLEEFIIHDTYIHIAI